MSYIVINRLPYAQFHINEDGIPVEFERIEDAVSACEKYEDAIIIDYYSDIRDFISLLTDAKFFIDKCAMNGVPDKTGAKDRIEVIMQRFNK